MNTEFTHSTLTYAFTVSPYNQAKWDTLTQATLSHQAKVFTLTQTASV